MRFAFVLACFVLLIVPRGVLASAPAEPPQGDAGARLFPSAAPHHDPYEALFVDEAVVAPATPLARLFNASPLSADVVQTAAPVVAATEYSPAYKTRLKIHKIASFAILPLFGTELLLGQSLYTNGGDTKKSAHVVVGAGIGTLFGINTVTGVWNLWESRKDTAGRTRRFLHSILMLASDAGFTATAALAPSRDDGNFGNESSTHRVVAITSIGIGTAGYLMMLLTK
jgi:hypothetical protein